MEIIYTSQASEDLAYWHQYHQKKALRIEALLKAIQTNPYAGIVKPEPLRFDKAGYWSRRIDHEHRLVYKVHENCIYVAQCRFHYKK